MHIKSGGVGCSVCGEQGGCELFEAYLGRISNPRSTGLHSTMQRYRRTQDDTRKGCIWLRWPGVEVNFHVHVDRHTVLATGPTVLHKNGRDVFYNLHLMLL